MIYVWFALFVGAIVLESITSSLVSIWFAASSIISLIAAHAGLSVFWQVFIFILFSIISLITFFRFFKTNIDTKKHKTNLDSLIGEIAFVEETIKESGHGRVLVSHMSWQAAETNGNEVKKGDCVKILKISGATLIVEKII